METEDTITAAVHVLATRLQTLRSLELSEITEADLSTSYRETLEEAYAALGQVETKVDELRAELEYHNQYFQEVQEQQDKGENP